MKRALAPEFLLVRVAVELVRKQEEVLVATKASTYAMMTLSKMREIAFIINECLFVNVLCIIVLGKKIIIIF
jgi:hypothetical protein